MRERWALRWMRWAVMAESGLLLALLFVSAGRRLRYPFALDWIEEGNLTEVARVIHHLPLYCAPTIHYTPYIYAPLFYWVSAWMTRWFGLGYPALRMVSILSTAGLFAGLFGLVIAEAPRRSPARLLSAMTAVGLFATAYAMTAGFLDVGRVDMLCLCAAILGLWMVRREWLVGAAAAFAVAMMAKQGILPVAVLALCAEWQRPRRLLLGLGSLAVFCAAPLLVLSHVSGGWSTVYLFKVAAGFAVDWRTFAFYLPHELLAATVLPVALIVAGLALAPPARLTRKVSFYALAGAGMVLYTGFLRAHAGAAGNASLPAYLWIAIAAGVSLERLYRRFQTTGARLAILTIPLLHMIVYTNGPAYWVPSAKHRALREHFLAEARGIPGEVLILDHPQLTVQAGKSVYADGKAMDGLITSRGLPLAASLKMELGALVHEQHFSALVVDGGGDDRLPADFRRFYPVRAWVETVDSTDAGTEPQWFYLPCALGAGDPRALLPGLAIDDSACKATADSNGATRASASRRH